VTRLWADGEPVDAWPGQEAPAGFVWQGVCHPILEVCNRWQVHTRWWEPGETLWREYWKVATRTDLLCLLYRDRLSGGWFLARLYD
jgi:hypothetical protein